MPARSPESSTSSRWSASAHARVRLTSSTRFSAPYRSSSREMCTFTPCSEITSSAAMPRLVLPRATALRITSCLGVSGRWIGTDRKYMNLRPLRFWSLRAYWPKSHLRDAASWPGMVSVGTAGARVGFLCTAPSHVNKNGAVVDHLTIHETDWAYCPLNARADGHDWKAT